MGRHGGRPSLNHKNGMLDRRTPVGESWAHLLW